MLTRREIDCNIAEKVMGQQVITDIFRDVLISAWIGPDTAQDMPPVPHYTTDIAAAWKAFEKLHARGLNITLTNDSYDRWTCRLTLRSDGRTISQVSDVDTAPLAICLAVLNTTGAF